MVQQEQACRRGMVVFAHADDAEWGCSGTVAKWCAEGWDVVYVVCTDGSKGSSDPEMTSQSLVKIREQEQRNAGNVLGLQDVVFLEYEDSMLEAIVVLAGLGGILIAGIVYMTSKDKLEFAKQALAPIYDVLFNKYYIDEIYHFLIVKPVRAIGAFFEQKVEKEGIDYVVDQVGTQVRGISQGISFLQSGKIRTYALNMVVGMVAILLFVVFL